MRFQVGDKVRIKSDLVDDRGIPASVIQENIHKVLEIIQCYNDTTANYRVKEDGGRWYWYEEMLEPVEELHAQLNLDSDKITINSPSHIHIEPPRIHFEPPKQFWEDRMNSGIVSIPSAELQINGCTLNKENFEKAFGIDLGIKKEKENIDMNIINIYFGRKEEKIIRKYDKIKEEIAENDEIQLIIKEMNEQIQTILENENRENEFGEDNRFESWIYTKKTQEKFNKANQEKKEELVKIDKDREVVKAAFELAETFDEKVKVLKAYGIYDKNGKMKED